MTPSTISNCAAHPSAPRWLMWSVGSPSTAIGRNWHGPSIRSGRKILGSPVRRWCCAPATGTGVALRHHLVADHHRDEPVPQREIAEGKTARHPSGAGPVGPVTRARGSGYQPGGGCSVLTPSTPFGVSAGRLASFGIAKFGVSAGQQAFCNGFDSRQLHQEGHRNAALLFESHIGGRARFTARHDRVGHCGRASCSNSGRVR
jgi:hypothetical protein